MKIAILLIGATAIAIAGPAAAAPEAAAKSCFRTSDIGNHSVGDNHTLYLNVGDRDVYKVTMRNTCLGGVSSSDAIELNNRTGSQAICEASDLDVRTTLAGGGGLPARCLVDEITKLGPAEAAAKRKAK